MIQMEIKGADAFRAALQAALVQIPAEVSFRYARWTMRVFEDLVKNTPQWSGDTAANWNYSVDAPEDEYRKIIAKDVYWDKEGKHPPYNRPEPLQRGDWAAVWAALSRAQDKTAPRFDQKVYFTNQTPIAPDLETNPAWIRPSNLVDNAVQMASFTARKWKQVPA